MPDLTGDFPGALARIPQSFRTKKVIGTCLAITILLNCLYWDLPTFPKLQTVLHSGYDDTAEEGSVNALIIKVSMLYGDSNPTYERALRNHEHHTKRWGDTMKVLRHPVIEGVWNKPAYLLSVVLQELEKPTSEQAKWLMWVDADTIILNPAIPPSIFLPPADMTEIHMLGSKDLVGLNAGILFLRIDKWTVEFLAETLTYASYVPAPDDLSFISWQEQEAMARILKQPSNASTKPAFREGNVYIPREWINSYYQFDKERRKKGDMLMHFPGMGDERWAAMTEWLNITERKPNEWEVPLEQTDYPDKMSQFWDRFRTARDAADAAEEDVRRNPQGTPTSARTAAISELRIALQEYTFLPEVLQRRLDELNDAIRQEV